MVQTMLKKNRIVQMLEQNQIPLGMQCFTGDPILIEIMGLTGFDWVMLDSEHSGNNPRAMEHLIRAAECVGLVPFVRVTQATDEADIHRALEAGAKGIFLPEIGSVEDVKKCGRCSLLPSQGEQGHLSGRACRMIMTKPLSTTPLGTIQKSSWFL